jgi:hypothetical protein
MSQLSPHAAAAVGSSGANKGGRVKKIFAYRQFESVLKTHFTAFLAFLLFLLSRCDEFLLFPAALDFQLRMVVVVTTASGIVGFRCTLSDDGYGQIHIHYYIIWYTSQSFYNSSAPTNLEMQK